MSGQRTLAVLLVLVLVTGVAAAPPVTAESPPRDIEDSIGFIYVSDAVVDQQVPKKGSSLRIGAFRGSTAVEKILNATKADLKVLEATCKDAKSEYGNTDDACELERITDYCALAEAKLKARIKLLRQIRGDRRKAFTKAWHRIGPFGRQLLRQLGNEVLATIVSGGTLRHGALRALAKKHLVRGVRAEARAGLARAVRGKGAVAGAAGLSACEDGSVLVVSTPSPAPEASAASLAFDSVCGVTPEAYGQAVGPFAPLPPYDTSATLIYVDWAEKEDVLLTYGVVRDPAMFDDGVAVKDPAEAAVAAGCSAGAFDAGSIGGCWAAPPIVLTESEHPGARNWAQSPGAYSIALRSPGVCWYRAADGEVDWSRVEAAESREGPLVVTATVAHFRAGEAEPYLVEPPLAIEVPRGPTTKEAIASEGPLDMAPYTRFVELLLWDPDELPT